MRREQAGSLGRPQRCSRSLEYSPRRSRGSDKAACAFSHGENLQIPTAGLVGCLLKKPSERRELLVTPVVKVRRMKPHVQDALAVARASKTPGELRTRSRSTHKSTRTRAGEQQHRTWNVNEAVIILAGDDRRWSNWQHFVNKIGSSARHTTGSASGHEPTEIGTAKCDKSRIAQHIQVADGITRENESVELQRMNAVLLPGEFKILPCLCCRHAVEIAMTSAVAANFMAALRVYNPLDHVGSIPTLLTAWPRRGARLVEQRCDDRPSDWDLMAIKHVDKAGADWPFVLGSKAPTFRGWVVPHAPCQFEINGNDQLSPRHR